MHSYETQNGDQVVPHLVDVNHIQCALAARAMPELARMRQSSDPFSLKDKTRKEQAVALFHLVGICNRLNWDFVLGPFAAQMWELTEGFSPAALEAVSQNHFRKVFGNYRRGDGGLNYKWRLQGLRAIARYAHDHQSVEQLLEASSVAGEDGAATLIRQAPVYNEDPLLKKCNALLHELVRRALISVNDPEEISPAVDYHIMRLYLRTGRVTIFDEELAQRLIARKSVRIEVITQIRKAVADALRYTAWLSGLSVSVVNDIEWAFARRACRRDQVWCSSGDLKCSLDSMCPNAFMDARAMITEPDSRHGHY